MRAKSDWLEREKALKGCIKGTDIYKVTPHRENPSRHVRSTELNDDKSTPVRTPHLGTNNSVH